MANKPKTQPLNDSVKDFIDSWEPELAAQGRVLTSLMEKATGQSPVRWGQNLLALEYTPTIIQAGDLAIGCRLLLHHERAV